MSKEKCCVKCFNDKFIQSQIEIYEEIGDCYFCGSKNINIADVSEMGSFILDCVHKKYEDAANSVSYCSQDGGYLLPTFDIIDILIEKEEIFSNELDDPEKLAYNLASPNGTPYVRKDPYGPEDLGSEIYNSWDNFCSLIKEKQRFTSLSSFTDISDGIWGKENPNDFFENLLSLLEDTLMTILPINTYIYRARLGSRKYKHKDLTSPPIEKTINSRMSPIGISVFYGSIDDPNTCISEIRPSVGEIVTVAKFKNIKPLYILDLAQNFSKYYSVFDDDYSMDQEHVFSFLSDFVDDIAKPIRDQDTEIEYTPTQAFTEFIKYHPNAHIDGLTFKSCLKKSGINLVLFKGPEISLSNEHSLLKYLNQKVYKIVENNVISKPYDFNKCN